MSDDIDRAQDIQAAQNEDAIQRQIRKIAECQEESEDCIDCGETIPAERRAVVKCIRCIDCQEISERLLTRK